MSGSFIELLVGPSLTRLVLFPVIVAILIACLPSGRRQWIRVTALVAGLIELALALQLAVAGSSKGVFGVVRDQAAGGGPLEWIPRFGIGYDLRMDGLSMPLVVLTAFLLPVVVLASWRGVERHWKGYAGAMMLLTTGIQGALLAHDLFLFYVFWEVMLVPMYLIIGIWGAERRIYAAVKFFMFTMAGSLFMLLGIVWLAARHAELAGRWSFAYADLLRVDLPLDQQLWLFGVFALAFAIKVPLFPFHTWLPDAHVQAPTGGSVILAGVLLKLGTYGLLRFALPLFPHAAVETQPVFVILAVVGILYGALVAWRQVDMKSLVAYSSVAHLGFVVLGLVAFDLVAWQGALMQMVNHGLATGALFLLVGMLYERRHTKLFDDFGGLAKVMPWFAFFLVFSCLASVGLPGLNGFVGEFLILAGSFRAGLVLAAALGAFGVILAAVYLFKLLHETLWGPITSDENRELSDLSLREIVTLAPIALLMLALGVAPQIFLKPVQPALEAAHSAFVSRVGKEPPVSAKIRAAADEASIAETGPEANR
ncbi:MAG: NuoM family protein [Thermoanaerobaculia bacterium]